MIDKHDLAIYKLRGSYPANLKDIGKTLALLEEAGVVTIITDDISPYLCLNEHFSLFYTGSGVVCYSSAKKITELPHYIGRTTLRNLILLEASRVPC